MIVDSNISKTSPTASELPAMEDQANISKLIEEVSHQMPFSNHLQVMGSHHSVPRHVPVQEGMACSKSIHLSRSRQLIMPA